MTDQHPPQLYTSLVTRPALRVTLWDAPLVAIVETSYDEDFEAGILRLRTRFLTSSGVIPRRAVRPKPPNAQRAGAALETLTLLKVLQLL